MAYHHSTAYYYVFVFVAVVTYKYIYYTSLRSLTQKGSLEIDKELLYSIYFFLLRKSKGKQLHKNISAYSRNVLLCSKMSVISQLLISVRHVSLDV